MYLHEHANIIGDPKHCDTLLLYECDKSTIYAQVTGKFMDVIIMNVSALCIMPLSNLLYSLCSFNCEIILHLSNLILLLISEILICKFWINKTNYNCWTYIVWIANSLQKLHDIQWSWIYRSKTNNLRLPKHSLPRRV